MTTSSATSAATPTQPPHSPELLALAKRVVWFKPPESTLANDVFFLNHLMVYRTADDLTVARRRYDDHDFRRALRDALPGIFDARSWAYWHARLGMDPLRRDRCGSSTAEQQRRRWDRT